MVTSAPPGMARAPGPGPLAGPETRAAAARLAALDLFAGLDDDALARLARGTRQRRLQAGELLWRAADAAGFFAVIEAGVVEIRQTTPSGEGVVMGLFRTGEAIGLPAALERGHFPADAVALGDAVALLSIRADALHEALAGSVAMGRAVRRALLEHTAALRAKIDIVSAGSVPRRLAALMVYLIERFGRPAADGAVMVDVALTREDIAQLVSARVETVIRILSRWHKAGWLANRAGGTEIARADMLRRILQT